MQDSIPGLKVLLSWSLDLQCLVSFLLKVKSPVVVNAPVAVT